MSMRAVRRRIHMLRDIVEQTIVLHVHVVQWTIQVDVVLKICRDLVVNR